MRLPTDAEFVDPFPPLVYKTSYDFDFQNIEKFLNWFLKMEPESRSLLEKGESYSSVAWQDNPPHLWNEFKDFGKFLDIHLPKVYQLHNIIDKQNGILNSWINIHDESGETLEHFHNHTDFVVTSYLSLPEGSGYIEFRDPLEYHRANTYIQPELELWKAVPCKTNDILIFPGWLKHRTQPNLTNNRRIVMTMNIGSANV